MPSQVSKNRKKNFLDVKWLLLSGALVSTLGFWGIFTKLDEKALAGDASPDPAQTPDSGTEASNMQVLKLPPLPTLVPAIDFSVTVSDPATVLTAPVAVQVTSPVAPKAPAKIFMGGSKPVKNKNNPDPITRTSSSR